MEPLHAPKPAAWRASPVHALAYWLAVWGGFVLTVCMLVILVSVVGRALSGIGLRPIVGDGELMQLGCGLAVFSFLPWCQITGGHVVVDVLSAHFPRRVQHGVEIAGHVGMSLVAALLCWRLAVATVSKYTYQETTMLLQWPVWPSYFGSFIGCVVLLAACLVTLTACLRAPRALEH